MFTKNFTVIIVFILFSLSSLGQIQETLSGPMIVCPAGEFAGHYHTEMSQETATKLNQRNVDDPCATFIVTYNNFTPEAEAAFQTAVDIWSYSISSSVPIKITANWVALGSGVLGSAGPALIHRNFENAPNNKFYACALANQIAGFDIAPTSSDIVANFNSDFSWYYGTDGNNSSSQYDLVSVVLHELAHGLGFLSSAGYNEGNGEGNLGLGTNDVNLIYDEFLLLGINGTPLSSLSDGAVLGNAFTSNNVYCSSPEAALSNSNNQPKHYAPANWDSGSSISHWDEVTFIPGSINSLMTPQIASGESIHTPGPMTLGFFQDMGWTICGDIPDSPCLSWLQPSPTSGNTDFNSIYGGAPCDDGSGCPFNEITSLQVESGEAYEVEGFQENGVYTFGICNGPGAGSWLADFTIIAPSGAVDAFGAGDGCSITWTASESGTYFIVINESENCGAANGIGNGYPSLTCQGGTTDCTPVTCFAYPLVLTGSDALCPDQSSTVEVLTSHIIPNGGNKGIYFLNTSTNFGIYLAGLPNTYTFNSDLNGLLSANNFPLFNGNYTLRGFVYSNSANPTGSICSLSETAINITFYGADTPFCDSTACDLDSDGDQVCNIDDSCPFLFGEVGDACDDNDTNTQNDVITSECVCLGTLVGGTINGNVDWNAACGSRNVVVSFYIPGTSMLSYTENATINSLGEFTVSSVDPGNYDVLVKVNGALARIILAYDVGPGDNDLNVPNLKLGDMNGDNIVNIIDLSTLNLSYGLTSAQPLFNTLADLNCDGNVNILDISIFNVSFGMAGDSPGS